MNVIACAGQFHEPDIAVDNCGFRCDRNSGEAEAGCQFALMHDTGALQILIQCVLDDQCVKIRRIGERAPHGQCVHHRAIPIGKGHGAGLA